MTRSNDRRRQSRLPSLSDLAARELARKVVIDDNGNSRRMPVIEIIFRQIAMAAAGGSHAAVKMILKIKAAIDAAGPEPDADRTESSREPEASA